MAASLPNAERNIKSTKFQEPLNLGKGLRPMGASQPIHISNRNMDFVKLLPNSLRIFISYQTLDDAVAKSVSDGIKAQRPTQKRFLPPKPSCRSLLAAAACERDREQPRRFVVDRQTDRQMAGAGISGGCATCAGHRQTADRSGCYGRLRAGPSFL